MQRMREITISFYTRNKITQKKGGYEVIVRLSCKGRRFCLSGTNLYLPEGMSISSGKVVKGGKQQYRYTEMLNKISNAIYCYYDYLEETGGFSVERLKEIKFKTEEFEIESKPKTIFGLLNAYLEYRKKEQNLKLYNHYNYAFRVFMTFLSQYHQQDAPVEIFDNRLLDEYYQYLKIRYKTNTANNFIKRLRACVNYHLRTKELPEDPFLFFKYSRVEDQRKWLSESELKNVINGRLKAPKHEYVRAVFLFACFTGLSHADIKALRWEDIVSIEGKKWIKSYRQKTGCSFSVMISEQAMSIIERFGNRKKEFVFPSLACNSHTNVLLHEVFQACEVRPDITFHCARHTFATLALTYKVSMESVSRMLGHKSITTTQIYGQIINKKIALEMKSFSAYLKKNLHI